MPLGSPSLALYFTSATSSTLASAEVFYTTAGTPTTAIARNTIDTSTGWGEVLARTAASWAGAGSLPAPTGSGTLLDSTLLVGNTVASGLWFGAVRLLLNTGTVDITADLRLRMFKRSSGGVYTLIVDMSLAAQTIGTTATTYNFPSTSGLAMSFGTGDELYSDLWANITSNANPVGTALRWSQLSTDTTTHTGSTLGSIAGPSYAATQTQVTWDIATRLRLLMRSTPNLAARLVLRVINTNFRQTALRLLLRATVRLDMHSRLVLLFIPPGTPLTLFGLRQQALSSTMSNRLSVTTGVSALATTFQLGTALGSAEISSQGVTLPWAALTTLPLPTGNGWFFESTLVQNRQFLAGTWFSAITLGTTGGSILADITLRVYVYTRTGAYVPVASSTLPAQLITSVSASYLVGSFGRNEVVLYDQEVLYLDAWVSVTQTTGTTSATLLVTTLEGTAATASAAAAIETGTGGTTVVPYTGLSLTPPNYRTLPGGSIPTRVLLRLLTTVQGLPTRINLTLPAQNDTYARLVLLAVGKKDIGARLLLQLRTSILFLSVRLRLAAPPKMDMYARLLLQRLVQVRDTALRIQLTLRPLVDITTRMNLLLNTAVRDVSGRVCVATPPIMGVRARLALQ